MGLEAQLRDVQFDGNIGARSIKSQDEVSFTWAEVAERHATVTSANEPSTHYLGVRIDGSRRVRVLDENVDKYRPTPL
jgi:hypothetical protein